MIGGLGVGFSLLEAVADDRWGRIVVAEREQAVIDWHLHGPLGALTASAVADPRTEILRTDLVAYLRGSAAGKSTTAGSPADGHEPPRNTPRSPQTPNSPDAPRSPGPSGSPEGAEHPEQPEQPEQAGQAERPEQYDALCLDIDNGPDWTVTEDNGGLYSPAGLAACRARLRPGGVLAIWSAQPSPAFEEALRNAGFTSVRTEEIAVARGVPDVVHLAIRGA
ncbi:spermidine synthase [Streptomyces sp. HSW2009]|uniref:spermidine synthase n=1 Tax=Streptomyces sp. HSW2009 TaxID=3142890 RepID=UPI0032EF5D2C